jgi:glycerol uptake facilitator-like aquaporin
MQVAGCALGAIVAHAMFAKPLLQVSTTLRTGPAQWFSEFVATFALVLVILGLLRTRPNAVPAGVALTIAAGYWFTASTSFANPAITLARALSDTFAGIAPADVPGFVAAQFIGAIAALIAAAGFGWNGGGRDP